MKRSVNGDLPHGGSEQRQRLSFDTHWRFFKGDRTGAERPDFDDATWRKLDVPHDYAIEGAFDPKFNPHTGGLDIAGVAWYRKPFSLEESRSGSSSRRHAIEFDGAMANARVFINGHELGERPYGYIGFGFDITSHLRFGEAENVLAVRLAPEDESSRWYPGAGIYRHVWLDITSDVHVARHGIFVSTPNVSDERADVVVQTQISNQRPSAAALSLETVILTHDGRSVARALNELELDGQTTRNASARIELPKPRRWDLSDPYLYALRSVIREGERVVDQVTTRFGVRTIGFDKRRGFLLNGRERRLQGVCLHHDLGALGAAVNTRGIERQLGLMQAMGCNAIRTSHNPPAPELLDACDRLGLLVIDEAFDMWRTPKVKNGYAKHFERWGETDLRDMIRRDRNHPSIILWSIGNEIPEQTEPDGWKIAAELTRICHDEDASRPTTAAFNIPDDAIKNGLADRVDIPGFNYQAYGYERFLQAHPDWMILGSETASTVSSRGVYHLPLEKYQKHPSGQLSSYDIIAPPWAYPPDVEFDALERLPQVLGEFVWTGFDYLGEPTPFFWERYGIDRNAADWPTRSSYFGIVDLAGFPKDRYYLYQSVWTQAPMVHLLPHWNWAGHEGQPIPVMVYTNAEEAELFLDGQSLGKQRRGQSPATLPVGENVSPGKTFASKYRLLWQVPYSAGALRVVASSGGKPVASSEVHTAGAPTQLRLSVDRDRLLADGEDLAYLTVRVEDSRGQLCPLADSLIHFAVEGAGQRAAVDNGDPTCVASFQADERHAFGGLCLLIVRPKRGEAGSIRVRASSAGLQGDELLLATTLPE